MPPKVSQPSATRQTATPVWPSLAELLAKYSAAEFAMITDLLERTTRVLAEETEKLRDQPDHLTAYDQA